MKSRIKTIKKLSIYFILCTVLSFCLIGYAYASTEGIQVLDDSDKWYEVTGKINSSWGGNIAGEITIKNISNVTVRDWQIVFPWDVTITSMWNGTYEKLGQWYAIHPAGYNVEIVPGASVTVGFLAQGSDRILSLLDDDSFFDNDNVKITHEGERNHPEQSEAPAETEKPEVTELPEVTESPLVTAVPEKTFEAEETMKPTVTPTANPEETYSPKPTSAPETTKEPTQRSTSVKKYEYDALNRLVKVIYEDGSQIKYEYDRNGNITCIKKTEGDMK